MGTDTFRDFILEQLATLPDLRCQRMFGGYGLYCREIFFAILFDGRLYFKTNPATLAEYMEYEAAVFAPSKKQSLRNYREVPADILEDSERLLIWARKAAHP